MPKLAEDDPYSNVVFPRYMVLCASGENGPTGPAVHFDVGFGYPLTQGDTVPVMDFTTRKYARLWAKAEAIKNPGNRYYVYRAKAGFMAEAKLHRKKY